jgi:hypothetical protein
MLVCEVGLSSCEGGCIRLPFTFIPLIFVPHPSLRLTLWNPSNKLRDSEHLQVFNSMADSIHVKLPDGSVKDVPKGTTALDIAKSISPRLADAALAAKTNGDLIDLTRPLEKDTDLRLLTDKDPEALEVYRHSSAHLLAAAGAWSADRERILLRLLPAYGLHSRRPGKDREEDAGTGTAEYPLRAGIPASRSGTGGV